MTSSRTALALLILLCSPIGALAAEPISETALVTELRDLERHVFALSLQDQKQSPTSGSIVADLARRVGTLKTRATQLMPRSELLTKSVRNLEIELSLHLISRNPESVPTAAYVRGTATDAVTGVPVGALSVVAIGSTTVAARTTTATDGTYEFAVPSGAYTITVFGHSGYRTTSQSVSVDWGTQTFDFQLSRGGRIGGNVTDAQTGEAITSLNVGIYDSTALRVATAVAGPLGYITRAGLAPGTYFARVDTFSGPYFRELFDDVACGWECDVTSGTPIVIDADETETASFSLQKRPFVEGFVVADDTAAPLESVSVYIYKPDGSYLSQYTGQSGYFKTPGLDSGTYYAVAYPSFSRYAPQRFDRLPCNACDPRSGTAIVVTDASVEISFSLLRISAIDLRGTVIDATTSAPLSQVSVYAYSAAGNHVATTATRSDGTFEFDSLAEGRYYLTMDRHLYERQLYSGIRCDINSDCTVTNGTPVDVTQDTIAEANASLVPFATVTGTLTSANGGQTLAGNVFAYDVTTSWPYFASSQSDGRYVLRLPAGTYRIGSSAVGHSAEYFDNVMCNVAACPEANPVVVTDSPKTVDFELQPHGVLSGTLTRSADGAPINSWHPSVLIYSSTGNYMTSASINGEGRFSMTMEPGSYFVTAASDGYLHELYDNIPCNGGCNVTAGTPVIVARAATTDISIALDSANGFISGIVTTATTSEPIHNALVKLYSAAGHPWASTYTNETGRYTFSNLPPGNYFATASSEQHSSQLFSALSCAISCDVTRGSTISVAANSVSSADFLLSTTAIRAIRPFIGTLAGGTEVLIEGRGFSSEASVTFGGTPASVIASAPEWLRVVTPAGAEGLADVEVRVGASSDVARNAFEFSSRPRPQPYLVRDLSPGSDDGRLLSNVAVLGNTAFFSGDDRTSGTELWKSENGATPVLVKDLVPGTESSAPDNFVSAGGYVFFSAVDAQGQTTIWRTDGSAAGTILLATPSALSGVLAASSDHLFFVSGSEGNEVLWRSDGSAAGTVAITPIPGVTLEQRRAVPFGSDLFFKTSKADLLGVYRLSGETATEAFTLDEATHPFWVSDLRSAGERLFLDVLTNFSEAAVLSSDGTEAGTSVVSKWKGAQYTRSPVSTVVNDRYYFARQTEQGDELWSTDGTVVGSVRVDGMPAGANIVELASLGNSVIISLMTANYQAQLWMSDGSLEGTHLVAAPPLPSNAPIDLVASLGGVMIFAAPDQYGRAAVWSSDGTVSGTSVLAIGGGYGEVVRGDLRLFIHHGAGMWTTDGTLEGTHGVALPGDGPQASSNVARFVARADEIYFYAVGSIYKSNGTEAGTVKVTDLPNVTPELALVGDRLFFLAGTDNTTRSLHVSDSAGERQASSVQFRASSLLFTDGAYCLILDEGKLWRSDGTDGGTVVMLENVTDAVQVGSAVAVISLTETGTLAAWRLRNGTLQRVGTSFEDSWESRRFQRSIHAVYFMHFYWEWGYNAVRITEDTTTAVNDDAPIHPIGEANGDSYYLQRSSGSWSIWIQKRDGSRVHLRDVTGYPRSDPQVVSSRGVIYFGLNDSELWRSDGTTSGTFILRSDFGNQIVNAGGEVYFSAVNGEGYELWTTDGTVAGTTLVADLAGRGGSSPRQFLHADDKLFFLAHTPATGEELFALPLQSVIMPERLNETSIDAVGGRLTFTGQHLVDDMQIRVGQRYLSQVRSSVDGLTASGTAPSLPAGEILRARMDEGTPVDFEGSLFINFIDVSSTHGFQRFVEKVFRRGLTSGCGGGRFCVDDAVTREQMALFLLRAKFGAGYLPPPATGTMFSDVPASSPFARWIEALAALGITSGCGGGKYCPGNPVTRDQMAVFLLLTREGSSYQPVAATGAFSDVSTSSPFARWVEELARRGITAGCGGSNYCPDRATTRGEMAVFLSTTFGW